MAFEARMTGREAAATSYERRIGDFRDYAQILRRSIEEP
jgi:hypothetical protein